jgi:ribonuclease HI
MSHSIPGAPTLEWVRHFAILMRYRMENTHSITIFSDGGARGNPGPAGAGAIIAYAGGEVIATVSQFLGVQTNNWAEYEALILALSALSKRFGAQTNTLTIDAHLDSELVVRQLGGQYKVRESSLIEQYTKVRTLEAQFQKVRYIHVPRSENAVADKLANEAMDRGE